MMGGLLNAVTKVIELQNEPPKEPSDFAKTCGDMLTQQMRMLPPLQQFEMNAQVQSAVTNYFKQQNANKAE